MALIASLLSLAVHYTAALVITPVAVWMLTRPSIPRGWKLAYVGSCLALEAALVPLLIEQHRSFPERSGVASTAKLTLSTLADMLEVPFNGRVAPLRVLGDVVTVVGVAVAAAGLARRRRPEIRAP